MIAYPLARMSFPGAAVVAIGVAATYLVPQPLLFIPMSDIINRLELGNTLTAVMLTYPTLLIPFCAWLLMGYFKSVPRELEEAARIDGASRLQAMLRVVLPLCTPGLLSAGIFAFTLAQNEFLYALIFLAKSEVRTVPVGRDHRADPGRRLLLGPAHGRRAARLGAGGHHLLVLRRLLRGRPHRRLRQDLASRVTVRAGHSVIGSGPPRALDAAVTRA